LTDLFNDRIAERDPSVDVMQMDTVIGKRDQRRNACLTLLYTQREPCSCISFLISKTSENVRQGYIRKTRDFLWTRPLFKRTHCGIKDQTMDTEFMSLFSMMRQIRRLAEQLIQFISVSSREDSEKQKGKCREEP